MGERDTWDLGKCLVDGVKGAVENHRAEGGGGGLLFSHLGGNSLPSNKLLSRSWFYKLTLLDGGMKGIAKGMGSTYKKGLKRISTWKGEDPLSV